MYKTFQEDFEQTIFNTDFGWNSEEIIKFWNNNFTQIHENEDFLFQKLQEYAPSNTLDYKGFFYRILYFFQLTPKNSFYSLKIIDFLKIELEKQRNTDTPEFYSNIIQVIYAIEAKKSSESFYKIEFYEIKKDIRFLNSDIYKAFLKIFIELGKTQKIVLDEFSEVFCQMIIFSVDEVISASIEQGWNYLIGLKINDFNRDFFKILDYFDSKEKRKKLEHYHKYTSVFTLDKYSSDRDRFKNIREKIIESFGPEEYKRFKEFIISEVNYLLDIYERKIHENTFVSQSINIIQSNDKKFILELLQELDTKKDIWGLEKIIFIHIYPEIVEEFIKLLKEKEDAYIIFRIYEIALQNKNRELIKSFEISSYGNEIKKILVERQKNQKKFDKEEQKIIQKQKKEIFDMLIPPKKGEYYPKLFQEYVEYSSQYGDKFKVFEEKERQKIDKAVTSQIKTYFSYRKVDEYSERCFTFISFEKKEGNSYTHCWDAQYMNWFLQIAKVIPEVKKVLEKNYKTFILFYPLMYGDEVGKYLFDEIIGSKIDTDDIKYIIKAYSEDLNENSKNLRFWHPSNFLYFYERFSSYFDGFEKQVEIITKEMIDSKDTLDVYYRENFLKIYAKMLGNKEYRKYWKDLAKEYPNYSYFENKGDKTESEIKEMRFFLTSQTILVEQYVKKTDIIWRIQQLLENEIEATSSFDVDKYPRYSGVVTWNLESPYSQLEHGSFDRENFAYIFSLTQVGKIDVSKEMLKILKKSLEIKSKDNKKLDLYANYLQKIFFKYFEVFDKNLFTEDLYYEIRRIIETFSLKITYNFNISFFRNKLIQKKINGKSLSKNEEHDLIKENIELREKNEQLLYKNKKIISDYSYLENELHGFSKIKGVKNILDGSPILLVEGKTDKKYLEYYYDLLERTGEKHIRPFIIQLGGCSTMTYQLKAFLDCENEVPIIGMYDFDSSGITEFYKFDEKDGFYISKHKNYNEGYLKYHSQGIYIFLIPVPNNRISKQVLNEIVDKNTKIIVKKDYGVNSLLEIEHLFYGLTNLEDKDKISLEEYFFEDEEIYGFKRIKLKIKDKEKINAYNKLVSGSIFSKSYDKYGYRIFENFKPIITLIDRIAGGEFKEKRKDI